MLIGLNGQIGAGKDEAYLRIKHLYEGTLTVERVSYATKLKSSAAAALGVEPELWEVLKREPRAEIEIVSHHDGGIGHVHGRVSVREYLQKYGTEAHRDLFGDNFWVDAALPLDFDHTGRIVCVTDMRFPNEVARVKELGGITVRVLNGPLAEVVHASEQVIPSEDIDFEVQNDVRDDGFAALDKQLISIVEQNLVVR